jgi:hypothetical protein
VISDLGEFSSFELGRYDETREEFVINTSVHSQIQTLWQYNEYGEPEQTSATIMTGYIGCDRGLVVNTPDEQIGFLSSKQLFLKTGSATHKKALYKFGNKLLASTLRKHKIPNPVSARLIKNAEVTPVVIGPDKPDALAITAIDKNDEKTAMAFVIATPDDQGSYLINLEDVRTGGPSDSEGYAGDIEIFLRSDLDGDGAEEILIRHSAYETFGTYLLRWDGKSWQEIADVGGGC